MTYGTRTGRGLTFGKNDTTVTTFELFEIMRIFPFLSCRDDGLLLQIIRDHTYHVDRVC